jgi:hypothetical protein
VTDFACGSRFKGSKFKVGDDVAKLQSSLTLEPETLNGKASVSWVQNVQAVQAVQAPTSFLPRGEDEGGLRRCFVTDDFDVVSVRVEDEGAVIVRMIMGPEARRAVVFSSGREGGLMKCVDQRAVVNSKGDMNPRFVWCSFADPEVGFGRLAKTGDVGRAGYGHRKFK